MECGHKKQIPLILRDLLASEEILTVFGENIIFFINSFIGSPEGLNLRNISWHGFISLEEFDSHYTHFLFVLFASCVKFTNEYFSKDFISKDLYHLNYNGMKQEYSFKNPEFMKHIRDAVETSYFVIPGSHEFILKSFEEYFKGRYVQSMTYLLPQFEHSLRRLYVIVHDEFPEEMLCAQSKVLFTTLDIILSLLLEDGSLNKLIEYFGENIISALNDIFVHYDGPRIRDKVAHGDVIELDERIARMVLHLYLWFLLHFNSRCFEFEPFVKCLKYYENYSSVYHPKSMFLQEDFDLLSKWKEFNQKKIEITEMKELEELHCQWNKKGYSLSKSTEKSHLDVKSIEELVKELSKTKGIFFDQSIENIENPIKFYTNSNNNLIEDFSNVDSEHRKNWLLNLNMLRKIIFTLKAILENLTLRGDSLTAMIKDRTARSSHRKVFVAFVKTKNLFTLMIKTIALIAEKELNDSNVTNNNYDYKTQHKYLSKIHALCLRMDSAIIEGGFGLAVSHFLKEFQIIH
jgi:hypothetical protein